MTRDDDLLREAAARAEALSHGGLPECSWVEKHQREPYDALRPLQRIRALTEHQRSCPVCGARQRFLDERFGPASMPLFYRLFIRATSIAQAKVVGIPGPLVLAMVGLVPVAGLLALVVALPHRDLLAFLVYLVALLGAILLAGGIYFSFGASWRGSALGRWFARAVAGPVAMIWFSAVFQTSGYSGFLDPEGHGGAWSEVFWIGLAAGLAFATLFAVFPPPKSGV